MWRLIVVGGRVWKGYWELNVLLMNGDECRVRSGDACIDKCEIFVASWDRFRMIGKGNLDGCRRLGRRCCSNKFFLVRVDSVCGIIQ